MLFVELHFVIYMYLCKKENICILYAHIVCKLYLVLLESLTHALVVPNVYTPVQ